MILRVTADGLVTLEDADDLKHFHLAGVAPADPGALRAAGIELDDDLGHGWVEPDAVRRLAGPDVDAEWSAAFGDMVGYAASKGWTDASGRLRAHTEWD